LSLNDIGETRVKTYLGLTWSPQYDEEDIHIPFVEGIDLGEQIDGKVELVRSSTDRRIQHILIRSSPAKALPTTNQLDGRA